MILIFLRTLFVMKCFMLKYGEKWFVEQMQRLELFYLNQTSVICVDQWSSHTKLWKQRQNKDRLNVKRGYEVHVFW